MFTGHYPRPAEATILVHPTLLPGPLRPAVNHEMRNRMPHTNSSFVRLACLALMTGALGCGSDLVLPDSPSTPESVSLSAAQGYNQQGPVGTVLGDLLVVKVITASQQPVSGMEVSFELSDPAGGSVDPTTATTNSQGEAYTRWTLGSVPGEYTATARLVQAEGDTGIAEFHAAATAGAPDTVSAGTPTAQPGQRNQPVGTPPQVRVVDRFGNPVPNTVVTWQVTAGGGQVSSGNSATDEFGLATIDWVLGDDRGYHKLTASVDGVTGSPVTFTAFVLF
jgi:Big-like domain-containing protein